MDNRISRAELPEPFRWLHIGGIEYHILQKVGEGASSIAYKAETADDLYIIKEFYPADIAKWGLDHTIIPCDGCEAVFEERRQKFETAKKYHANMGWQDRNFFLERENIPDAEGFVIMRARAGDTLYQWRQAQKLSIDDPDRVKQHIQTCVKYIRYFAKKLDHFYHSKGYLHLDIKPENVFVFADEVVLLRLFDFDSMQTVDGLFRNIMDQCASVYTTPLPNGPYGNEVKHINQLSAKIETPEQLKAIDYYALGNLFYFMLYGCYYEDQEVEPDEAVSAYLEQYPALKAYLNDLFGAHFFCNLKKRIYNINEADLDFSYIDAWFFHGQKDFLQSFDAEYLSAHFKSNMMPALFYHGEEFQGRYRLYQLLQKTSSNIQIIGQGGSGKSTLLKYFAYLSTTLFSSWKLICYYEELHDLINDKSVEQLVKRITESGSMFDVPVIWLLDAFDEVDNKNRTEQLLDQLNKIDIPEVRIVISSRSKIGCLNYPVVQMMTLSNEQRKNIFRPTELKNLPFNFEENNFLATPLAINLIKGMNQHYNGNKSQSFQEYLIGERQPDGTIKIASLGELVWNYLHIITLSSALDSDLKVDTGWNFLHKTLTNTWQVNVEAHRLENGLYDDPSPYLSYKSIPEDQLYALERFEKLNFYSIIDISRGAIHGHKIEFAHKIFRDFFSALDQYHVFENLIKTMDKMSDEALEDYIAMNRNVFSVLVDMEMGDNQVLDPKSDFSLCKDIFHSSPEKQEILTSCLDVFRNHFDENPFEPAHNMPEYTYLVLQILNLLYIYENDAIVFRNLDLSNLALGELSVYDNFPFIRSQSEPVTSPDGTEVSSEDIPRKDVIFENVKFDGSMLLLKGYCWYQFKNCSFKNLNENSFIHPSLNIPGVDACCVVGQDLYSINRNALMDCIETGDTGQEIVIYSNTEYVDWEFAKHYTKRTRPIRIREGSVYFHLDKSDDALFQSKNTLCFLNDSTETRLLDYVNLQIKYAALWHCNRLKTLCFYAENVELLDADEVHSSIPWIEPLSKCVNLNVLEFDGIPVIAESLFQNCPQIKGIHLLSNIPFSERWGIYNSYFWNWEEKEYRLVPPSFPDENGLAAPLVNCDLPQCHYPSLFVPHNLVQKYLNSSWWCKYFIYDEKRLPEIDDLPINPENRWRNGYQSIDYFDAVCEEDDVSNPYNRPFSD